MLDPIITGYLADVAANVSQHPGRPGKLACARPSQPRRARKPWSCYQAALAARPGG